MNEGKQPDYCLRHKISIDNPNNSKRDPVIYRSSDAKHHITGGK